MNNQVIEQEIKNFIANTPLNTSQDGTYHYFDEPIIGFANVHDPLFREIADHIDPEQYPTASDWLARELGHEPAVGTVIAWSLPISQHVLNTNRTELKLPSIEWAHVRYYGEQLNNALRQHMRDYFHSQDIPNIAPQIDEHWSRITASNMGISSNWSERHAAYVAGLGTFSLNDALITVNGIAHRVGSIIVATELPATERPYSGRYDYCLYYNSGICGACIHRCPSEAISKNGHSKPKCFDYTRNVVMATVNEDYGVTTPNCGLCQTRVPCERTIPRKPTPKPAIIQAAK